jgi:protein TonB
VTSLARRPSRTLSLPIGVSAVLHAGIIASIFLLRASAPRMMPPMYRVDLVAAPPGVRAPGIVTDAPAPVAAAKAPPKAETRSRGPTAPVLKNKKLEKVAKQATPNVTPKSTPQPAKPATKAGGGTSGGVGADVATVRTEGIEFPFPGYLTNIVRQIALNFSPRNPNAPLKAEVMFLIRRDGSVTGFRFLSRSGSYAFDLECQGAVEAVAAARAFGPLPAGFTDDVLPVIFSFDPRILR